MNGLTLYKFNGYIRTNHITTWHNFTRNDITNIEFIEYNEHTSKVQLRKLKVNKTLLKNLLMRYQLKDITLKSAMSYART